MKEAILVFSIAGMAVLLAPTALWVRGVGFAAATLVYWRYVWKYKGVEETRFARSSESANASAARTKRVGERSEGRPARPCSVRRMPDLPALDVAIGLVFVYPALALVCSTINESISTAVGLRARFLQAGILSRLTLPGKRLKRNKSAMSFYAHPLVQGLIRTGRAHPTTDPVAAGRWWRKSPYPSYLPSRTAVSALLDIARDAEVTLKKADAENGL